MILKPLSDGSVTGTGTLAVGTGILGAVLITADGSNDATIKLHADNSDGEVVFQIVTKSPLFPAGPIRIGSQALYYDVTGTGAAAHIYEWVE